MLIPRLLSVLEQVPFECNFFLAQGLTSWEQTQVLSDCKTIDFSAYTVINALKSQKRKPRKHKIFKFKTSHLSFAAYLKGCESIRNKVPDAKTNKNADFKV